MSTRRSIVFTHVPRTAGSSTHYAFLQAMGAERAHVLSSSYELPRLSAEIDRSHNDGQVYLGGHFTLDDVTRHTVIDVTQTVNFATLRDPLDRFLSHHALIQSSEAATDLKALRPTSVAEFVDILRAHGRLALIDNPHCVTLCGVPSFESARDAIRHRYDFVALAGQLEALIDLVTRRAGQWDWPGGTPRLPDFPHNGVPEDQRARPSEADLRLLQPFLAEDRKLLEWVKRQGGLIVNDRAAGARI